MELEPRGGEYWGLSPFKEEKTPSFSVRASPPCFYDYSSGIAGNVFTFVRYYFHCSGDEAIKILTEYAGIDVENTEKQEPLSATKVCKKFMVHEKKEKESSGVTLPDDYMSRYEKRADKLAVWEDEGISSDALGKFQVFYDGFSNRLVYPIRNMEGKIVNVGGRTLDPDWKEKNLRKYTYFFNWGTLDTIYGLSENMEEIQRKKEIILFEGAKSVMTAYGWGIRNCGAILTSHLNPKQMMLLAKLGHRVVFALDRDVDILMDHNIRKLAYYCRVEYIIDTDNLLSEKDSPVDKGEEVFQNLYENRRIYRRR